MDKTLTAIRCVVVIVVAASVVVAVQALNFTLTVFAYNVFAKLNLMAGFASLSLLFVSFAIVVFCGLTRRDRLIFPALSLVVTLYYTMSIALLFYRIERRFSFDFFFLWHNISDAYQTAKALIDSFIMFQVFLVLILLLHWSALVVLYKHIQLAVSRFSVGRRNFEKGVLLAAVAFFSATGIAVENEPLNVIRAALTRESEAAAVYLQFFEDSIKRNKLNNPQAVGEALGQNVFLIALESLNANLVTRSITPRLVQIAERNGVLFPKIQSSSILSIRAQETFLCSVLPALRQSLAQSETLSAGLVCLPKILKNLGYMTIYFHSFSDIRFANTDYFMDRIGFDERHASSVMKPTDMRLGWGYGEDIFYKRVFEYLERYKGRKLFVYIHANTINHYPFYNEEIRNAYPKFTNELPFSKPGSFRERMANTMYLQDHFFGNMYEQLFFPQYGETSNMIVLGDHSWPVEIHPGNRYNENQAFQENFVSSLVILPAKRSISKYSVGKEVTSLYSQLDILPTMLEMLGFKDFNYYGKSFFNELKSGKQADGQDRCVLSVQPFSGGYVAVINYPIKLIFNLKAERVSTYDLQKDPDEMRPIEETKIDTIKLGILRDCLNSIKNQRPTSVSKNTENSSTAPRS